MAGRPKTDINIDEYIFLTQQLNDNNNYLSNIEIADRLGVSTKVLRRFRKENADNISGILGLRPIDKDNNQIAIDIIRPILEENDNWGHQMLMARVNVSGYSIGRDRLKRIVESIDPNGAIKRRTKNIKRREYYSKGYGAMLHIDTNHKLGNKMFGFIVAIAVDGATRFCPYINVEVNNGASTSLKAFKEGVRLHGLPSRVRADRGGEGIKIARYMLRRRGLNSM